MFLLYLVAVWQSKSTKKSMKRVGPRQLIPSFSGSKQATGDREEMVYEMAPASSFFLCEFPEKQGSP